MSVRRDFLVAALDGYRKEKSKWLEDGLRIRKAIAEVREKIRRCDDEQRQAILARTRAIQTGAIR